MSGALAALLDRLPPSVLGRTELLPLLFHMELDRSPRAREAYVQTLAKNARLVAACNDLQAAAHARGLRLVPLKGADFAQRLYPDVATRPMADLDFLVEPTELDTVIALHEAHGFERAHATQKRFDREHAHDVAMTNGRLYIELHYRLFHELELDAEPSTLLARATPNDVLALDDHLMLVMLHAASHAFGDSPLWLVDAALLLDAGASRNAAAVQAARRGGARAFSIACELFDHPRTTFARALLSRPPARFSSLTLRALMVQGNVARARWLWRKLALRVSELATRS